ncbi:hypothetical protein L1987_84584 [Smallanthus sonchifolius]|uniref:Uncharacterized protein n=1 Tax=Smallanthus sonchifolius TaxID=185202 RepID=A0ACB8XVS4_9ASTR|nr:hypothetical protein L1987_84584 [Smallanthus sonchifolius]
MGEVVSGPLVADQFISHFKSVLGSSSLVLPISNPASLFSRRISDTLASFMEREVTDAEIKSAMSDIDDNKASGPDDRGPGGVSLSRATTGLWRLMELDLIQILGWVDKNQSHQSVTKAWVLFMGSPNFVRRFSGGNHLKMEEDPGDVTSTPNSGNSSIPASNNECVMNMNDVFPLSSESDNETPEITMLLVDLNPRFDELASPKGNYHREMGENCSNPPEIPAQRKKMSKQVENVWNRNQHGRPTFAEQMKANNETEETRLEYFPPTVTPSGGKEKENPSHFHSLPIPSITPLYIPKHPHTVNPSNPPSNKPNPPRKPQSSPKPTAAIAASQVVNTTNRFTALDSVMTDCPIGPHCNPSEDQIKFYEFSEDTIENVLKFKPSALSIPRVNDSNLDLGESLGQDMPTDDDIPDFDITNAQKKAIASRLEKFGAVKAVDQEDWSQGEWEYFHYMRNSIQIDPNTCIEDVDSDSNGTARFFKYQLEKDLMGEQETHAPTNPLTV